MDNLDTDDGAETFVNSKNSEPRSKGSADNNNLNIVNLVYLNMLLYEFILHQIL